MFSLIDLFKIQGVCYTKAIDSEIKIGVSFSRIGLMECLVSCSCISSSVKSSRSVLMKR